MVLKMSSNKTLSITKPGNTFEDENNAEIIKFILYKKINDIDIRDCVILLNFINSGGKGKPIDLTKHLSDYSDEYYVVEVPMSRVMTSTPGVLKLWVEFYSIDSDLLARTGQVTCVIQDHDDIVYYLPDEDLPVLYEILTKVNAMNATVDDVHQRIDDLYKKLQQGQILMVNSK